MTAALVALLAALQEDPRVVRAARLDETTVLFETPPAVTVHVVDTERGRADVLWSAPGLALARLPQGAARARLISEGRLSEFWPLADARPVTYGETPSNARRTVVPDGLLVENGGTSPVVVVVRVQEPERRRWRFLGALAVVPGENRAVALAPGTEALIVRPEDATGGLYQAPPEPPAARRQFGGTFGFNDGPLAWRGLGVLAGGLFGRSLEADLPSSTDSDGTFTVRVEYDDKEFEVISLGLTADLGLLRVSAVFLTGHWEGRGDLEIDDGISVTVIDDTRLDGDLTGAGLSLHWPALTFHGDDVEIHLGPEVAAFWIREELDGAEGSPIDLDDTAQELLYAPGARASFRIHFTGVQIGVDGAIRHAAGDLAGMVGEVAAAVVFRF